MYDIDLYIYTHVYDIDLYIYTHVYDIDLYIYIYVYPPFQDGPNDWTMFNYIFDGERRGFLMAQKPVTCPRFKAHHR